MQLTFTIGELTIVVSVVAFFVGLKYTVDGLKNEVKGLKIFIKDMWENHVQPLNKFKVDIEKKIDALEIRVSRIEPPTNRVGDYLYDAERKDKDAEIQKKIRSGELKR